MGIIYEDTRQQRNKHEVKHRWFEKHGVELIRKKLDFGDYTRDGSNVTIDTKKGLSEISVNLGKEHDRLVREIERAQRSGYRIVFLIEHGDPITSLDDVPTWMNPICLRCSYYKSNNCAGGEAKCIKYKYHPMTGATLYKIMQSMRISHDVTFEIVHPLNSAKRICELLGVDYDDR